MFRLIFNVFTRVLWEFYLLSPAILLFAASGVLEISDPNNNKKIWIRNKNTNLFKNWLYGNILHYIVKIINIARTDYSKLRNSRFGKRERQKTVHRWPSYFGPLLSLCFCSVFQSAWWTTGAPVPSSGSRRHRWRPLKVTSTSRR